MANSNNRVKDYNTVHHLVSRIAHRVHFLKDDERMDFLEMVRRTAEFTGIRLVGWCVMGNHFHLLVYLPVPEDIGDSEVLRRYGVLKGEKAASNMEQTLSEWRKDDAFGESRVKEWIEKQKSRMYDVSSFMKIVKQWFTAEYNKRNAHKGTLWESTYFDRIVKRDMVDIAKCLGYIHLNPVRAAECDRYDGYTWSSYTAFCKSDPTAVAGMRFVYGQDQTDDEIANMHEGVLDSLLEKEKLRRAEEIARRREAGYEVPVDPLTSEALIAQEAARLKVVQKELLEMREEHVRKGRRSQRRAEREKEVLALMETNPEIDVPMLAERLSLGIAMIYRILGNLKESGMIERNKLDKRWIVKSRI
jgi:REP element-mobilizing transposase RayT